MTQQSSEREEGGQDGTVLPGVDGLKNEEVVLIVTSSLAKVIEPDEQLP